MTTTTYIFQKNNRAESANSLTADDLEHAAMCLRAAATRPPVAVQLLGRSRAALTALLALPERAAPDLLADAELDAPPPPPRAVAVEQGIHFAALSGAGGGAASAHRDELELSLSKALQGRSTSTGSKLSKVTQLTGELGEKSYS